MTISRPYRPYWFSIIRIFVFYVALKRSYRVLSLTRWTLLKNQTHFTDWNTCVSAFWATSRSLWVSTQTLESKDRASATCLSEVWLKGMTLIYVGSEPPAPLALSTISTVSCLPLCVWRFGRLKHTNADLFILVSLALNFFFSIICFLFCVLFRAVRGRSL